MIMEEIEISDVSAIPFADGEKVTSDSLDIYTDGGCRHNPGIGAWAFAVIDGDDLVDSGTDGTMLTTNTRMELTAVLNALKWIEAHPIEKPVNIYSDSQVLVNTVNTWYDNWVRNGDVASRKNIDLISEIMSIHDKMERKCKFSWIKGHSVNIYNNMVDGILNVTMNKMERDQSDSSAG